MNEYGKHRLTPEQWDAFAGTLRYVSSSAGPEALAEAVAAAEEQLGEGVRRLHYLSVPPKAALDVISMLDQAKLVERARVVMEKPFGTDLESAVSLNEQVHEVFDETQIFRIDHFLGKEAAQNVLALRFANGLFEPIWNRNFIDHIQIDVPETLGLDRRADFYESTGAYKDMIVTHLFQVLAFVAMEPPTALDPRSISEETALAHQADDVHVGLGVAGDLTHEGRLAHAGAGEHAHALPLAHRQQRIDGPHPQAERPLHPPAAQRVGAGRSTAQSIGVPVERPAAVHRLAQAVEHPAQQPLAHQDRQRPAHGVTTASGPTPVDLAQRHQHRLVAAEADHLGAQARGRLDDHHLAHANAGHGGPHHQAGHLGDPTGDAQRVDVIERRQRLADLDERGLSFPGHGFLSSHVRVDRRPACPGPFRSRPAGG